VTAPTLSLPLAVVISLATAVVGGYAGMKESEAELRARMVTVERSILTIQSDLPRYTPGPQFELAIGDIKRELDEIRGDVKEIRRGVQRQ
jgi:hypothetical protein